MRSVDEVELFEVTVIICREFWSSSAPRLHCLCLQSHLGGCRWPLTKDALQALSSGLLTLLIFQLAVRKMRFAESQPHYHNILIKSGFEAERQ